MSSFRQELKAQSIPEGYTIIKDDDAPESYYKGCLAKQENRKPTREEKEDRYFMKGYKEMTPNSLKYPSRKVPQGNTRKSARDER